MPDLRKPIVVLNESFRKLVDKFNVLSNNVGEPLFLKTHNDSDVVTTINEINATFNPFQGKIVYPNDSVPTGAAFSGYDNNGNLIDYPSYTGAQLPNTHLTITTNQHGGQDIDIDAGRDFLVDAVRNINLTSVDFDGDYSGNYNLDIEGTSTVDVASTSNLTTGGDFVQNTTGHIDLNASSNIILDAGADVILDAGDSDIFFRRNGTVFVKTQMGISGNANKTRHYYEQGGLEIDAEGGILLDANGDIVLDAEGNDIKIQNGTDNDEVIHNLGNNGTYTITAPANFKLDAVGDIILDADGNDLVFRNGGGGDSAQINLSNSGNLTVTAPAALTLDIAGDINVDAGGDNIRLKDGGTTRQEYTLGATTTIATTGNRTETVTGIVSDSADGNYHIGATGNMDIDTRGTFDIVSGSTFDVVSGGNATIDTTGDVLVKASGDITLDAEDDIVLDANGADIVMKDGGVNKFTFNFGTNQELDVTGDFILDATGDIILDAGDSDIVFKRNGTEFTRHRLGFDGNPNQTRIEYSQGPLFLDVSGDIIMEADGGDVYLKDDGVQFLRFTHAGNGNAGINNNDIRVITFEDSDAVFENDVNIEGDLDVDLTLNVDGATTLNANVTLGNQSTDQISATGQFVTSLVPLTDNTYSIGNSTKEWKHGYFDGTVFADNLDGDSGTIANFNFNGNTAKSSAGMILDATNDITLNARGEDIVFKTADSAGISWNLGRSDPTLVYSTIHDRSLVLNVDRNIYFDAGDGIVQFRDSANSLRMQVAYTGAAGTEIDVTNGSLIFDVSGDITLDANGGDVLLRDNGTQYARFQNTSNNLRIYSGDSESATFTGKNVAFNGTITPGTTLNTVGTDLVTAINEIHDDVGTISSLSTFYNSHNADVVTALNRVAARIIDVYDENGTLLNN